MGRFAPIVLSVAAFLSAGAANAYDPDSRSSAAPVPGLPGASAGPGGAGQAPGGAGTAPLPPVPVQAKGPELEEGLFKTTLPLDISTSGFYELAAWAKSLGLSDSGSAAELRKRLYAWYGVEPPAEKSGASMVSIEHADDARYFKVEDLGGGMVSASGGVILSLKEDNGSTHRIEARELTFDRDRNAVAARGSVRYARQSATGSEYFAGEALSASLDDWSGVFLDGKVRRAGAGAATGDRGLVLAGETMRRQSGNVLVFDNGVISSCDATDPHYAVRAGRVWILGDNEWAVSNALFSLGNVPVLWLPFFYYPGDEIVFHPVIGYRTREGRYVQTTTYLVGRKAQKEGTTSIFSMSKGQGSGPTEVKGLFLRRVDDPRKTAPDDGSYLKFMVDLYSSLGAFAGMDGSSGKRGPLEKGSFAFGLGLSRSIFGEGTGYSPFDQAGDWESVWNRTRFLKVSLPLRFGLNMSGSFTMGAVKANLALPLFSDPFFEQDFRNRSEDMEWLKLIAPSPEPLSTVVKRTALNQRAELSMSWQPQGLSPWLGSVELSRLAVSVGWLSKSWTTKTGGIPPVGIDPILYSVDPAREFFFPDQMRPADATLSLRGSLLSWPSQAPAPGAAGSAPASRTAPADKERKALGELRSPWEEGNEAEKAKEGAGPPSDPGAPSAAGPAAGEPGASQASGGAPGNPVPQGGDFRQPARAPSLPPASTTGLWTGSLGWNLTPSGYTETRFRSAGNLGWYGPADIDFSRLYQLYSYHLGAGLDARLAYGQDLATISLGLAWADQDQIRPYNYGSAATDDASYAAGASAYKLADYQYKNSRLSSSLRLGSRPLAGIWFLSASSLSYSLDATLYSKKFLSLSPSNQPQYQLNYPAWNQDGILTNSATINLAYKPRERTQSLALTANLPPTTESYSPRLGLDAGFATFVATTRAYRALPRAPFSFDPLSMTATLGASPWPVLSDSYSWDYVNHFNVSNTASIAYGGLTASLLHKRSQEYSLDAGGAGWQAVGATKFLATDLSFAFNQTWKDDGSKPLSSSLSLSSTLNQSLLRFSESVFTFGLALDFKLNQLLTLSFSSLSQNSTVWKYYPDFFPAGAIDPRDFRGDLFADLIDSLTLWDRTALRRSPFKLKSLSAKMSHDLHDWDLSFELSVKPLLDTINRVYKMDPAFSILLAWRDIPEMKSAVRYDSTNKLVF